MTLLEDLVLAVKESRADVISSGKVGTVCGQHLVLAVLSFVQASPVSFLFLSPVPSSGFDW